jgi:opacity protein-like surface antigen
MKKFLLIFLSFILISATHAYGFKLMGGGHLTKYAVLPEVVDEELNYKVGFMVGGGIELFSVPNISLDVDGFYSRKGSKVKIGAVENEFVLDVISITPVVRVKLLPGPSPYVLGGGEFSYILTHKLDEVDIKDQTKSYDYGLVFGAGYQLATPGASLFIEGRYHHGLANILKDPAPGDSIKTKGLVIVVGLKI